MKFRLFALILTLALSLASSTQAGWTQDTSAAPAAPNSAPASQAQGCCHHSMADMKDGKSCCHHGAAETKEAAACCGKDKCEMKDGKSCCEGKDTKSAMKECKKDACCADGKCCSGKSCGVGKGDKAAMGCCGGKCERHSQTAAGS